MHGLYLKDGHFQTCPILPLLFPTKRRCFCYLEKLRHKRKIKYIKGLPLNYLFNELLRTPHKHCEASNVQNLCHDFTFLALKETLQVYFAVKRNWNFYSFRKKRFLFYGTPNTKVNVPSSGKGNS